MRVLYFILEKLSGGKLSFLFLFFSFFISNAQVTTNSGSGLAPTYPDLATAITALNGASITSPVVITLTGNETAPAGGYSITAQGTLTNTIIIEGVTSTITANAALTVGALNDGIFKLIGADYVTIRNFTMLENAANTVTAAATNTMTEWGVALLYATTTNGAQNNTIQNNTIDLNRTYQNTFGIYSNSTHAATTPTTSATATTSAGTNSGLKVYSNIITDVNNGIVVVGPTAAADHNDGMDIGGASLATGNTLTNYGTTSTFSGYANVSGTVNGILVRNSNNTNISYNSIASSVGGVTGGTLNGIHVPASSNAPTVTFTNTISNNSISLRSGVIAGAMNGITYPAGSASATSTLNITNNDFNNFGHTVAGTGAIVFISTASTNQFTTINNNTFTNITVNTTGSVTFIVQSFTAPSTGTKTTNNNSIVTGFSKTGAGGTVLLISDNGSTVAGAVSNCQNNNFSNITLTGATTLTGINYTDGGTAPSRTVSGNVLNNWTAGTNTITAMNFTYWNGVSSLSNNTITNITGQGTVIGIVIGNTVSTATSININGNIINNLSSTGVGGTVSGLTCNNASTVINIFGNTINTLSSTGASVVTGIIVSGSSATGTNVYKNKIYDLLGNNAGSTVNGILLSGGNLITAYNNIIGDLRSPLANAANPLNGINITGGTTANIYNNTVMINGTSSGALFGSSAINASTTPTVNLRNNIFVNNSSVTGAGLAVAYRRSTATLTSYAAASNNNLFYASTIFTDGTNTDATLNAYKTRVASRDASSISENPTFVSTTGANANFLHIDTVTPTQIESGGSSIGSVTDDFDGDLRNGSTPDIGADEFTGVSLDLTAPTITYSLLSSTCDGSVNRTLTATITDATGVPTVGIGLPVLYWRINAGAWNAATGTFVSGSTFTFSFGAGAVVSDVVSYYIVAQDTAGTPNVGAFPSAGASGFTLNPPAVGTPPTTPSSYTINLSLNGVYTVGVGGNYTTLTAAVSAYNTGCMVGPVTFDLIDATYPSETFPITINQNPDASAINTLTIKPAVGATPTISGSLNAAIFVLNGADYVNINGSSLLGTAGACLVGGDTSLRGLTFQNTNVGTSAAVISVQSGTNGAQNNVIKNVNVIGQDPTTTLLGISLGGNTPGTAGTDNDNNIVENCSVQKAIFGIYSAGQNLANQNAGTIIRQNDLSATGTNRIRRIGMVLFNENNANVSFNNIGGIESSETADAIGIALGIQNITNTASATGGVTNALVTNNRINGVTNDNTYSASGIAIAGDVGGANTISNNMISNVIADATSGDLVAGIFVAGATGSNTRLYHNTVEMSGDRSALLTPGTNMYPSYGVAITGVDPIVDIMNNILVTSQTATVGTNANAKAFAIGTASTAFTNLNSNYNNFISTGAQDGGFRSGSLATAAGTDYATLALWTAAITDDANSVEIAPVFVSATDLHLIPASNASLDNLGTPIATVTADFDCATRSLTTPDLGADEFCAPTSNVTDVVACDTYTWAVNGTTYTTSGTYTNVVGCHTETLNLTINITPVADAPANVSACDSYTLPGLTVGNYFTGANGTGTALFAGNAISSTQTIYVYAQTGTTPNCTDENSFVVTITPSTSNSTTASACDSYTWAVNGTTYTSSGTYTNVVGCHTDTLNLTITPSTSNSTTASACDSYTWAVNGTTYTSSGTYTNVVGCHTETLNLTITPSTSNSTTASACDSYTWAVNGTTYTSSGTYTNVVGCHTETLNLTITPSTSNSTTASACDSYTWAANGTTYTSSGTYTNVVGCHTETLNLTITPSTSNSTTASACDSYTWAVNGITYTSSGTYTNVVGCHTETLNLTITTSTSNSTTASACDSYTWAVNGTTYTSSGTYINVVGCHTETLNLTITTSTSNSTTASACDSYTWAVNGTTYTSSGTYTNVVGCHTETLNLTITTSTSNATTTSACNSYTWAVNGTTYTSSGTYTNVVGCHTETLNLTITTVTTPTGSTTQVLNGGVASDVTIEDIVVSGTGIVWYPTALDATNGTNPILAGTQLVDGATYYAVSESGICRSTALGVTVTVVLGTESFDFNELNYYPNPVVEILNVRYNKNITSVQIFDLSGRMVKAIQPNTDMVEINLRDLSSAMYIVKLQSEDNRQAEIKIWKK